MEIMSSLTTGQHSWHDLLLAPPPEAPSCAATWSRVFSALSRALVEGHRDFEQLCQSGDELLARSAWDLWQAWVEDIDCYDLRSSEALRGFWSEEGPDGRAVLVLDAFSLREAPCLLAEAARRGVSLVSVGVVGAPAPTTTDAFAAALGVSGRSSLKDAILPAGTALEGARAQVFEGLPFDACAPLIPHAPRILIWHDLVDARLHSAKSLSALQASVEEELSSDAFWLLVDRLRQGRELVITSDHGYASRARASLLPSPTSRWVAELMRASRCVKIEDVAQPVIPPLLVQVDGQYCLIGNRQWAVAGGFPELSHGGLSLLEVAVPIIRFSAK